MSRYFARFLVLMCLAGGHPVWAESGADAGAAAKTLTTGTSMTGSMLTVTLGLIAVLLVIFGAAWILRRYGNFTATAKGALKVVGGLSIGTRERIVLLQVGQQQLLIGVAPGRIQTLHVLEQPILVEEIRSHANIEGGTFAQRLATALKKGGKP